MLQIVPYTVLHMAEPIPAQMLAAIPTRDDHNVVLQAFSFEHAQDHHSCTTFPIVVLDWSIIEDRGPGIVRCAREFLVAAKKLERGQNVVL